MMENETKYNVTTKGEIFKIDPRLIIVMDGWNSRMAFEGIDELAEQIKAQGMLNPISVQAVKVDGIEKYKLIDGERRYRAVMKLINDGVDIARVPALKLSVSMSEEELLIQQFQRNEGKNFTEYELGIFTKKMMDRCGKSLGDVARAICKNVGVLSYAVQLLELDMRVQDLLKENKISGANVRRIYKYHQGDEEGAVQEILGLQEKAEEREKKEGKPSKLSLKDLNVEGKTIVSKDSKDIIKGLNLLFKYKEKMGVGVFNVKNLMAEMNNGRLITDVFNDVLRNEMGKAE